MCLMSPHVVSTPSRFLFTNEKSASSIKPTPRRYRMCRRFRIAQLPRPRIFDTCEASSVSIGFIMLVASEVSKLIPLRFQIAVLFI